MLFNSGIIHKLLESVSTNSIELWLRYPTWRMAVLEAFKLAPLPMVEGSTYNWRANSKGSAIIQDKQGNVLLAAGNGFIRSSMSDKQLSDFEQMLTVASSRTKFSQKKASGTQFTANSRTKDKGLELD